MDLNYFWYNNNDINFHSNNLIIDSKPYNFHIKKIE